MKDFKEFVNEDKKRVDEGKGEFSDSGDATEFFMDIMSKMHDKRLMSWAKVTDQNFDTKCVAALKKAISAYDAFVDELEKAE